MSGSRQAPCRFVGAAAGPMLRFNRRAGPAPELAIRSGSGLLSLTSRLASTLTQPGRHPRLGAQKAFYKSWYVDIRIHGREVDAKARRADLNFIELRWPGVFQPFYIARRETHGQLGAEMNCDLPGLAIVMRGNRSGKVCLQSLSTLVCLGSAPQYVPDLPSRKSIVLPDL
jgi:hypothetical protein